MAYDFNIYNPHGQLVAVLEAKPQVGVDAVWAAEYRRNLIQYLGPFPAEIFALATPEHLYLWNGKPCNDDLILPDETWYIGQDLAAIMGRPLGEPLPPEAFELLISTWLFRQTLDQEMGDKPPRNTIERVLQGSRVISATAA